MSTPVRTPDAQACPACSLVFPSRSALRRHDVLDHRPAPDGALLVAQIVGTSPADPRGEEGTVQAATAVSTRSVEDVVTHRATGVEFVLVLLSLAATTLVFGPVGLLLWTLAWVHWAHAARRQPPPRRDGSGPGGAAHRSTPG